MQALSGVTTCLELLARGLPEFGVQPTIVELERWEAKPGGAPCVGRESVIECKERFWDTAVARHRRIIAAINRCRPHLVVCNDQRGWPYLPSLAGEVPVINVAHVD